jgi:glyoxylase-like metal-dependent hydrolase (beta-lactamase superfamily II)
MTDNQYSTQPRPGYSNFKQISTSEDWFENYEIATNLFVFYEPRHYEATIVNLLIGQQKAALIDTGCGIGNLRKAVEEITDKPVIVINTHTHLDHLPIVTSHGGNGSIASDHADRNLGSESGGQTVAPRFRAKPFRSVAV